MSRMVAVAFLSLSVFSAFAQAAARPRQKHGPRIWVPQVIWKFDDHFQPKATVPKEMIASLRVSEVTIPLEEYAKLEDMRARFGGKIGVDGDAADSLLWLCLHGR